ncbi:MAG: DUF4900 domain-containing protein [Candidatus Omnitrophica bacterium]|nr:DUF4900 domain-containing protein [Candidatus Omnitrophota bacterium]
MRRPRQGSLLLLALVTSAGISTLLSVGLLRTMNDTAIARRAATQQRALALAEAGLDAGVQWLLAEDERPVCSDEFAVEGQQCASLTSAFTPELGGIIQTFPGSGSFTVTVDPDDLNEAEPAQAAFTITASGTTTGIAVTRTAAMTIKRESFSKYLMFWNKYKKGQAINMTGAEVLRGPVHVNDNLYIMGSPTFLGPVSYTGAIVCTSAPCNPTYAELPQKLEKPIPMPEAKKRFDEDLVPAAKASGIVIGDDAVVRFEQHPIDLLQPDGPQRYELVVTGKGVDEVKLKGNKLAPTPNAADPSILEVRYTIAGKLVILGKEELTVEDSILHGQVTLASQEDMTIQGHIIYACNPDSVNADGTPVTDEDRQNNPACDNGESRDLLGLVSRKDIIVDTSDETKFPDRVHLPDPARPPIGIMIQGSVMALRTFTVKGAYKKDDSDERARIGYKGRLHLFGGLIQDERGLVGWNIDAKTGAGDGFDKDYVYDARLLRLAPPSFPNTGRYDFVAWAEQRP